MLACGTQIFPPEPFCFLACVWLWGSGRSEISAQSRSWGVPLSRPCYFAFPVPPGLTPVGPESQIQYFMVGEPTVTKDYIALDINVSVSLSAQPRVFWKILHRLEEA